MSAPQITLLLLYSYSLLVNVYEYGKGKQKIAPTILAFVINNAVLYWGGFWSIAK